MNRTGSCGEIPVKAPRRTPSVLTGLFSHAQSSQEHCSGVPISLQVTSHDRRELSELLLRIFLVLTSFPSRFLQERAANQKISCNLLVQIIWVLFLNPF